MQEIEEYEEPRAFLLRVLAAGRFRGDDGSPGYVHKMPKATRLALEMVLHEENERRALEGELWRLRLAWKEAEEIAAIADDLLLPDYIRTFIKRHRRTE